jgi:Rrf2 family protein
MELTRKGDYAIRVVLDLAAYPPGTVVGLQDVGRRQGIPPAYLFKIVQALSSAGLVRTFRGVGGGARLERPSAEVTLRQVIEAVEGPILLNRCVLRAGECPRDRICPVHRVWCRIQGVLLAELEAVNFAGLVQMPPETRGD